MLPLIKPKEITVFDGDGDEKKYTISKFPAVQGLEINALYPTSLIMSSIPKIGDYKIPEELMFKILHYVTIDIPGTDPVRLDSQTMINNHVSDWEALIRIIWAIMEYNNSFFRNGTILNFFGDIVQKVLQRISEISIQSSEQFSKQNKPH